MKYSNDDNLSTGILIRKLRADHQMSQQELADRAGVSFSFVNQVEGGKPTVRLDALNKLLKVFGYQMMAKPSSMTNSVSAPATTTTTHSSAVEQKTAEEPELPPVTIHRPKNDWSFY